MVKLFCAIVGVAGSAFPVDIDTSQSVGDVKKAIKNDNSATITCDAKNLQLFLAKKGDAWLQDDDPGVLQLEEGRIHPDVQTLNDGDKIRATWTIKDVMDANHLPTPQSRQLHVLVEVPPEARSQAGVPALSSIEELGEIVEKRVYKVFEDRDKKRSVYSLSDLNTEQQDKMAKKMRLADKYIIVDEPTPSPSACIPPYTWLDVLESADNQRAKYMTYLETHLKGILDEKRLSLLDIAKDQTALSISDPRLPFGMKGTTDVLLVDSRSTQHREPLAGVRMVIELQKKVEKRHKAQAFGELVAASLKAPLDCTPIGLLTDLTDQWHFSWFNEKKVLTHLSIVHPKNAFDFIAAAVCEPASSKPFSVPFIGRELTKFKIDDFLPMPDNGADEMMERYELMADVVEPEFLMARRMEYAQQLVQSMPMYAHMYA